MTGRTVVTGGTVLTGPPLTGEFRRADVLVVDGAITAVEPDLGATDAEVVDATGTFVLPGFVDAHAHLWESTMRGLTADWDLLRFAWGIRFHHAALHRPDDLYAGALAGALAMLEAGTTTVLDHVHHLPTPDHVDAAQRAVLDSSVRAVWCYGLTDTPGADSFADPAQREQDVRRARAALTGDRVTFGLAPNDITSVPWEATRAEFTLGRDLDVLTTGHLHSTWGPGRVPEVEWLARDGLLGGRQVFSHAGATSEEGLRLLAEAGAALASTPDSELQMGLGFPIFARAAALGVTVGLGSDLQANNSPDAFAQMRLARQAENGRRNQHLLDDGGTGALDGVAVTVRQALHLATLGGATALGLGDATGSVEVGKAADLVLVRHDRIGQRPVVDPFATVVMHSGPGDVDTVLVGGEVVKRAGRLVADVGRASGLVEAAWESLSARMVERGGPAPALPEGMVEQMGQAAWANRPAWVA